MPRTSVRPGPPYVRAALVWFGLALAILFNDAVRDFLYQPLFGYAAGGAVASVVGIALVLGAAYLFVGRHPEVGHPQWVRIGFLWLALTVGLEIVLRRYVAGVPWDRILADYDLFSGRIRGLVVLSTLLAPVYWSRRLYRRENARLWFKP